MYRIYFYQTVSNKKPVNDFIKSLSFSTREKIVRSLDGLAELGPKLTVPYSKQVVTNLFELRIKGKVEIRLFYSFVDSNILILHGFIKKTMKIPTKEITTAIKRRNEYT